MGKRLTVKKMLTTRLAECKSFVRNAPYYNDLANIFGSEAIKPQVLINMETDINQLEYLIDCLEIFARNNNP